MDPRCSPTDRKRASAHRRRWARHSVLIIVFTVVSGCVSDSTSVSRIVSPLRDFDAEYSSVGPTAKKLSSLNDSAIIPIIRLLVDENELVRSAAEGALLQMPAAESQVAKVALARSGEISLRVACARIIGKSHYRGRSRYMTLLLKSEERPMRRAALSSLRPADDEHVFELLSEMSKSEDAWTASWAVFTMARIGKSKRVDMLTGFLTDTRHEVRESAIYAFFHLDRVRYADKIAVGLMDSENAVIEVSVNALLFSESEATAESFVRRVARLEPNQIARVIDCVAGWRTTVASKLENEFGRTPIKPVRNAMERLRQRTEKRQKISTEKSEEHGS